MRPGEAANLERGLLAVAVGGLERLCVQHLAGDWVNQQPLGGLKV